MSSLDQKIKVILKSDKNKSEKASIILGLKPTLSDQEVAKMVGCTVTLVRGVRRKPRGTVNKKVPQWKKDRRDWYVAGIDKAETRIGKSDQEEE